MCGGGRRAHHAREEAKREANRQANEFAAQLEAQERANQAMIEALKPGEQKYTPPPMSVGAALGTQGVRPRKSRKASTLGAGRGISSLRIPLNVGAQAGGTNIPT
jgi:hypothetical protein